MSVKQDAKKARIGIAVTSLTPSYMHACPAANRVVVVELNKPKYLFFYSTYLFVFMLFLVIFCLFQYGIHVNK